MSTTVRGLSPILDGYLDELDAATAHLPADEAFEIRDSIAAHIADATLGVSHVDDDDARRIVRDLGPVSMIVNAAGTSDTAPTRAVPTQAGVHQGGVTPGLATQPPHDAAALPTPAKRHAGYARIACVLAIVTAASMFFFWPLSLVTGLCAIGFGIAGLRAGESRAESWTGIGVGLLPLVLAVIYACFGMAVSSSTTVGNGSSDVTTYPATLSSEAP